jgi:hypothetical protein
MLDLVGLRDSARIQARILARNERPSTACIVAITVAIAFFG